MSKIFWVLFSLAPALAATQALRFGKLVDGTGRVLSHAVVVVEGDRIRGVGSTRRA